MTFSVLFKEHHKKMTTKNELSTAQDNSSSYRKNSDTTIHLQAEKIRNRAIARTYGKTSENLVPESAEKMEKRKQDRGGSLKEGRNSGAS